MHADSITARNKPPNQKMNRSRSWENGSVKLHLFTTHLGDFEFDTSVKNASPMHNTLEGPQMGRTDVKECDYRAVQDAYREQISFGNAPKCALNLATIVYLQRHPKIPAKTARVRVDEILAINVRDQ